MHRFHKVVIGVSFGQLEARFGWSDKSFTKLLELLTSTCPNDCLLYKNEFAEMSKYPTNGVSRYKVKDDECSDEPSRSISHPV